MVGKRIGGVLGSLCLLAVGGCATRVPVAPASTAALPEPVGPRPELPAGIPERLAVPPVDAAGQYRTINSALSDDQRAWHVRSALNVAVLSCRGSGEAVIAADYNDLLKRQKAVLAKAYAGVQAQFRAQAATDWQTAQDAYATRVYNFFALPPAKPDFCAAATALLTQARTVAPEGFGAFAVAALPRLEAPFLDVYRRYDRYRSELAQWEARQGGATRTATAGAAPKLEYVGVETLLDWSPGTAEQRTATR